MLLSSFFDFYYASGQQIRAVQFREGTDKAYAISSDKISYLNNSNRIIKLNRRGYTFPRNIITSRLNISAFNLFKAGIHFYKAKDENQLIEFLREAKKQNLKTTVLGAGSNTLFRDNGVKGVVIKLGNEFSYTKLINKNILDVGAATLDRKVSNYAKENNVGNLEFLSCIPGTIGGGVRMNSGCYGEDISKILVSVQAMDLNGKIKVIYALL